MSITRYDPFRDLRSLQDEVNRLFSTSLGRGFDDEGLARGAWMPSVDIFENKDSIVLEAELPGMNREDFELTIENNTLTLRGERRFEKRNEGDNYHRVERSYGSFTRSFTLPQGIDEDQIAADFNNGVLTVRIPKAALPQPRRIQVGGGTGAQQQVTGGATPSKGRQQSGGRASTSGEGSETGRQTGRGSGQGGDRMAARGTQEE
jgi:HSP20 family protein